MQKINIGHNDVQAAQFFGDEKDKFGQTPLHLAVFQQDNMPVARLLIDSNANIHEKDNDGRTPTMSNKLGRSCCTLL